MESGATIPAGTHIALALRNTVDTKHSKEGDRIYLETIYPVAAEGRIAIPRGSFVNGTVTISKPAGRVKGKGELFIRFDSLTLPNGATRDFRSRLDSADRALTSIAKKERLPASGTPAKTWGVWPRTTVMGASLGGLIGAAKGSALKGVGIGSAAGAAVGLGSVLLEERSRRDPASRHYDGHDSGSRSHLHSRRTALVNATRPARRVKSS